MLRRYTYSDLLSVECILLYPNIYIYVPYILTKAIMIVNRLGCVVCCRRIHLLTTTLPHFLSVSLKKKIYAFPNRLNKARAMGGVRILPIFQMYYLKKKKICIKSNIVVGWWQIKSIDIKHNFIEQSQRREINIPMSEL